MKNKFLEPLLKIAKKVDLLNQFQGSIYNLTKELVNNDREAATKKIFTLFQVVKDNNDIELLQLVTDYNDLLLKYYGYEIILDIYRSKFEEEDTENKELSLSELMADLDELIGLDKVKSKINSLISFQQIQLLRKDNNLSAPKHTLHIAFIGNPGTGKTTVARIIGRMYKQLGLLSKGHFVEVSRTDLIAGYQGQTALKVKKVIEEAKGGVLFIDEAYSITENEQSDSYGKECLTELTKALEDYRNDLVVIVAGYKEPMEVFFNSNPGLKSRFNTFIDFEDFNNSQLKDILFGLLKRNDYKFSKCALNEFDSLFERILQNNSKAEANGRFIRNLFDDLIQEHAIRVSTMDCVQLDDLIEITSDDIKSVLYQYEQE